MHQPANRDSQLLSNQSKDYLAGARREIRMARFTLQPQRWYACQFIGDEFSDSLHAYSPIKVRNIKPMRTGKRAFELDFYHANYPEGVRDKSYELTTIERGLSMMLAKSTQHKPVRMLLISAITMTWLDQHFPALEVRTEDLEGWLDRSKIGVEPNL